MSKKSYQPGLYLGIDLGTTNTLAARALVNSNGELGKPEIVPISQQIDENGNQEEREIFPSALIEQEGQILAGQYAHSQAVLQGQGIAFWKNSIGLPPQDGAGRWFLAGREWSSEDAASAVLAKILEGLRRKYPNALADIRPVVTIPASFPEAMKEATKRAILHSGLLPEGKTPVLLYEPIAAVIAYLAWYEQEQLPLPPKMRTPDWSEGGRILVFDIGGGTVDVTLVQLVPFQDPSSSHPTIRAFVEDYAPHTLLGGFRFDETLAHFLFLKFLRERDLSPDDLSSEDTSELQGEIQKVVETLKIRFSSGLDEIQHRFKLPSALRQGKGTASWVCTLTRAEFQTAIAPLLGHDLTCESPLPPLEERKVGGADSIVEPVIRLLQYRGLAPSQIDAVLMVGGMSHVEAIRQRVMALFGPDTRLLWNQTDPLRAVALGAAIHHAQIDSGLSPHHVALRPASLFVRDPKQPQALRIPLIPKGQSLMYGETFKHQTPTLHFPAGRREITLKTEYAGIPRRGIRFSYPPEIPSDRSLAFVCTAEVDSHDHQLLISASLLDHPAIHIETLFDEHPAFEPPPEDLPPSPPSSQGRPLVVGKAVTPLHDPEANRVTHNPNLLRSYILGLTRASDSATASRLRRLLERAAFIGAHVRAFFDDLPSASADGYPHTLLLLGKIYHRYTHADRIHPLAADNVRDALLSCQPLLVERLQHLITSFRPPQIRSHAAIALGYVGLWNSKSVDISALLAVATQTSTPPALQAEIFRAIGRLLYEPADWLKLLRLWSKSSTVGGKEAALWAICRVLTRYPSILLQVTPLDIALCIEDLFKHAWNQDNTSLLITAWRTAALLSLTSDIGRSKPIYAESKPHLLPRLEHNANLSSGTRPPHISASIHEVILRNIGHFRQATLGHSITLQMLAELEDLPLLLS